MRVVLSVALAALLAGAAGCASDLRRVADANASHYYAESLYEEQCVRIIGPPRCAEWQRVNDALKREFTRCNEARKIGHLPSVAKKRLRRAVKAAEKEVQ